ncbi:orc1/cdc6 family replication initiation protein (plasmid) [Halorussus limi]|uniref:ORC1-type DNA replication protein n=1 Tax=Halorussus limi TaxID=2938695 RepID=A0A8U0I0G7_9EURY|nr:orc1/cdc6 family replication initiation protein [Halorussus limi]UPV76629.1 orc1/cdc6 family replication initiation protein [Halorussus limi]
MDDETTSNQSAPPDESERDPVFIYEDKIFQREKLLDVDHVPESTERIVGRDEHISRMASAINPVLFNSPPTHLIIYGKTGTGKSLIARHITQRLSTEAARENIDVETIRIDCGTRSTEAEAVKTLARKFNDEEITGVSVPEKGLGTGDYYDRLWEVVEQQCDVVFFILDEIDKLKSDEILRNLSRAGEDNNVTNTSIGVIGVSNKIDYSDTLSERVKSSFQYEDIVFKPYDANQLREILRKRKDAFKDEVLSEDVIPLCAALCAKEHGDARKAMSTFRNAGKVAREQDKEKVTEEHVYAGKERAEMDRFNELIRGTPPQGKAILLALTLLTEKTDSDGHSTRSIYNAYEQITGQIDMDCLSERRVGELLEEQDFLNVIQAERTSRGRGKGMYKEHRLLEETDIVKEVLVSDSRFDNWR